MRQHRRERRQHGGAEVAVDPDRIPGGCWVPDVMVVGRQVSRHHQDPVSVLPRAAGRQEPQFSSALHGRGAVTGLELGVDAADVGKGNALLEVALSVL